MIVYQATKQQFLEDVFSNEIETIILSNVKQKLNKGVAPNEIRSWANSLAYMDRIMRDSVIPDDCGVAIEYQIPQTSKRIDFIITGHNETDQPCAVLVELKQWTQASITDKDAIVNTFVGGRLADHPHPSYQAWSYATLLQGFNEVIYSQAIPLHPCAYLHNYQEDSVIRNEIYADYIEKAPVFLKSDAKELRDFIRKHMRSGDKSNLMYRIDQGRIRPSKMLADNVGKMLKGNSEFIMIDDQKVVFENAISLAKRADENSKQVLIVEGGPGTGKSVVALNLLAELLKLGLLSFYVSKNAAPRAVYEAKLSGTLKPTTIRHLFRGSGAFIETDANQYDALIVDEAHRLNRFSGLYGNQGENQIKEIIKSAKFSVFFIDENQRVTLKDIGTKREIELCAYQAGAKVTELDLKSQFRCNGSDGYLAWLDNILQIRDTANQDLKNIDYDFRVIDSPTELRELIIKKNSKNNRARMVAGYCWKWKSKKDPHAFDIEFPEYSFAAKWNLTEDGSKWIISPNSVNEVGCIHTCQGLELDYIGVIIGNDMIIRNGIVITDVTKRATSDNSVKGYKKLISQDSNQGKILLDTIIKNTYRTLMTRGMRGCYIYCTDKETAAYFNKCIGKSF